QRVRVTSSLAAAALDSLFEHPAGWSVGIRDTRRYDCHRGHKRFFNTLLGGVGSAWAHSPRMLAVFLQSLEQSVGPSLVPLAQVVYGLGACFLLAILLTPLVRVWLDHATARTGLGRYWVMTCPACGRRTIVTALRCGHCENNLILPWPVRWWTAATRRPESRSLRRLRWSLHLAGGLMFLALSLWVLSRLNALHPQGTLHQLFLGALLLSWGALGWLVGRTLRLDRIGVVGRIRDGVLVLAAVGAFAVTAGLAEAAKPVPETRLASFTVDPGVARVEGRLVLLDKQEVGFEYLQVDHSLLSLHTVVPLAFLGKERLPLTDNPLQVWLIGHLRAHAESYAARGLRIRQRSDWHRVQPGQAYEIVDQDGQVLIRPALG
ncbi:MAG: hypothetical protein ACREI3_00270, partial [Nitrospirales bacterium]